MAGLDFSPQMLEVARRKSDQVEWVQGDALELPFADGGFAAATVAWGVRNLADHERGFREMARVVRDGGRVVCLEMTTPPAWAAPFAPHLDRPRRAPAGPRVARDADAYSYLPESVRRFPDAPGLAAVMRAAGLEDVRFRRLMLGVVAVHVGTVPA